MGDSIDLPWARQAPDRAPSIPPIFPSACLSGGCKLEVTICDLKFVASGACARPPPKAARSPGIRDFRLGGVQQLHAFRIGFLPPLRNFADRHSKPSLELVPIQPNADFCLPAALPLAHKTARYRVPRQGVGKAAPRRPGAFRALDPGGCPSRA